MNGILQGSFGDILNKVADNTATVADLGDAIKRLVLCLSRPLQLSDQLQIVYTGKGAAIDITAAESADPIALTFSQGGETVTLGLGLESFGVVANQLVNRDVCQTDPTLALQAITAKATGSADPGTGLGTTGTAYGSGDPSRDTGTASANPNETLPAATISGYQRVATGNFVAEGLLLTALAAATNGLTGATTAQLQTWVVAGSGSLQNGPIVTVTNRDTSLSAVAGKYCFAAYCNGELRPQWLGC